MYALLTMQHLLAGLEPGLLTPHVQPLLARLRTLLSGDDRSPEEIERRIRIIRIAARPVKLQFFELAATATLKRRRLRVTYWARSKDETTERELSPQRLVFYRGNAPRPSPSPLAGEGRGEGAATTRAYVCQNRQRDMHLSRMVTGVQKHKVHLSPHVPPTASPTPTPTSAVIQSRAAAKDFIRRTLREPLRRRQSFAPG